MVKEFLLNYQQNLISSKIETEEELDLIQTKIRENEKFIAMLRTENDSLFTDFSPREIEGKHKERIRNLNETLQGQYDERLRLTNIVNDIDRKLKDLEDVIAAAEQLEEGSTEISISNNDNFENISDEMTSNKTTNTEVSIIEKGINRAIACLPADPIRAKIELQDLLKKHF